MTCSLIITTYNWSEALELSLKSVLKQTLLPDEIIIADDGSTSKTKELINKIAQGSNVKIIHSWQEDDGFRASRSRNLAFSKSTSEYIIYIDGDMILEKNFVKDHLKCASRNFYIQGSRVLLKPEYTETTLKNKVFKKPSIFSNNLKNKLNSLRVPFLSQMICRKTSTKQRGIKSCNFSFYREDFIAVNGFDENLVTWGREDSELINRMYNNGMFRKDLKFSGIQYHLYHKEGSSNSFNDNILKKTIDNKLTWCENGVDKHMEAKNV
jgi:glycosyltransferase involved in cell wall biosynthesis